MPQIINPKQKASLRAQRNSSTSKASSGVPAEIRTAADYRKVMARIDTLMDKGSEQLKRAERSELRRLASVAEQYEEAKYPVSEIKTIAGLLDQKMYDMRLTQGAMARLLGISDAKLSLILNGRQKPDVAFIKSVHQQLDVDANLLLNLI